MSSRFSLSLAAALALTGLAQPVVATSVTPISKIDWEPNQQVAFRWKEDSQPPGWMRNAVLAAATDSNDSRDAKAAFLVQRAEAASWVAYTEDIPSPAALAYASRRAPDLFKVWLRPQGHVFDWGALRWCQFYIDWPKGCFDAETVTLHEFGHVQGLGHIENAADAGEWLDSIMHTISRQKPKTGWDVHEFGPCDVAALQIRYELLSPATPVSDCLSLATSLTLVSSATTVPAGDAVVFTATLRISAEAPYSRLASDPLNSRTVSLQKRAIGASSWSGAGLMAPGPTNGTYRLSHSPTATYEWRAVFSQPDEGLQGSNSAILKVTVSASGCNPYCVE